MQLVVDDQGDWQRSYFDRVIRRMIPERDSMSGSGAVYFDTFLQIFDSLSIPFWVFDGSFWLVNCHLT